MAHLSGICMGEVKIYGKLSYIKNMPKAYIDYTKKTVPARIFNHRLGGPTMVKYRKNPDTYQDGPFRPWESPSIRTQQEIVDKWRRKWWIGSDKGTYPYVKKIKPVPEDKWMFFIGDKVMVNVGKDKGKIGVIKAITRETNAVWVDQLNTKKEYMESMPQLGLPSAVKTVEQPMDAAAGEISLVHPDTDEKVDAEWVYRKDEEDEDSLPHPVRLTIPDRFELPVPAMAFRTYEYEDPAKYQEKEVDTKKEDLLEVTFKPSRQLFEEEIMAEYNIVDNRQHPKTFWYASSIPTRQDLTARPRFGDKSYYPRYK